MSAPDLAMWLSLRPIWLVPPDAWAALTSIRFVAGDCRNALLPDDFDAAIGRLVLMYTGDVTEALQAIVARVKPGGVVAFAEADFSSVLGYMRASSDGVNRSMWEWASQAFACSDILTAMAGPLHRAFLAGAGLVALAFSGSVGPAGAIVAIAGMSLMWGGGRGGHDRAADE